MRRAITAAWAAAGRAGRAGHPNPRALASAAAPARPTAAPTPAASSSWARYFLFLPPAIAAYLCHWQVDRKAWKEAQLARWEAALQVKKKGGGGCLFSLQAHERATARRPGFPRGGSHSPRVSRTCGRAERPKHCNRNQKNQPPLTPTPTPLHLALALPQKADPLPLGALPPSPPELTRVLATGTLAHDRAMLVGPRPRSVAGGTVSGFLLVTPLLEGDGGSGARVVALVVRGWVPAAWGAEPPGAGLRGAPGAEPAGWVTLDPAIVRGAESPSRFVPANAPATGAWHWLDPPALAAAAGAAGPVPFLEALAPPDTPPAPPRGGAPPPMDVLGGRTGRLGGGGGGAAAGTTTSDGRGGGGPPQAPGPPRPRYPDPRRLGDLTTVTVTPADHRNYALTWGSLAAATAGLAAKAVRAR